MELFNIMGVMLAERSARRTESITKLSIMLHSGLIPILVIETGSRSWRRQPSTKRSVEDGCRRTEDTVQGPSGTDGVFRLAVTVRNTAVYMVMAMPVLVSVPVLREVAGGAAGVWNGAMTVRGLERDCGYALRFARRTERKASARHAQWNTAVGTADTG